jgi:hypothetical protein
MSTYETDFYRWTQETAEKLRQGRLSEVNMEELIEELEDMGKSQRRALERRLALLLMHLLKWQYQPERRGKSWRQTVKNQRKGVKRVLKVNPSLKSKLVDVIEDAYEEAVGEAALETGKDEDFFPPTFEQTGWSWEQVLDVDWLPD